MIKSEGVFVALGGLLGAGARYSISTIVSVPLLATFIVNIVGCIFIGFIFAYTLRNKKQHWVWPLLATGFCGGFTTMSTLSMELVSLITTGDAVMAAGYLFLTLLSGLGGVLIGYFIQMKAMYVKEVE